MMEGSALLLSSPLSEIPGIGPKRSAAFTSEGIRTVEDLLCTLPFRYEDRSRFIPVASLVPGAKVTVMGRVRRPRLRRTRVRGFTLFDILLEDDSGELPCVWFNQPYLTRILREGTRIALFGTTFEPGKGFTHLHLRNPQLEVLDEDEEGIHTGRIVPIYRKVGAFSCRRFRSLVHQILRSLPDSVPELLPSDLIGGMGLGDRLTAFREVHFPASDADRALLEAGLSPARRRLALEELFILQDGLERVRAERESRPAASFPLTARIREVLESILPFALTGAQRKALEEIAGDLSHGRPMGRLLQGDVGSGKTIVALLAAVVTIENGGQVAWMVPTEILAEQHLRNIRTLLARKDYSLALLASGVETAIRRETLRGAADGDLDLVVGTHALVQREVKFRRLGLVIVDEQHRFGVEQRGRLGEKGENPHLLLMTATPIPRSLALGLYGDLEISVIDEMPAGRRPVKTFVRKPSDRDAIYRFLREQVASGGRAVIVYPRLETDAGGKSESAVRAYARLARGPFAGVPMGLIHGRSPATERRRIMEEFAEGRIPILVATTVLEVGIDVSDATLVLVEEANRLGLAQLHQIRGRVGRGHRQGWCILVRSEDSSPEAESRLVVLAEVSDGFEIARRDLQMRGPGEFLGKRQSGDPELRIADLGRDEDLLEIARAAVKRPGLPSPVKESLPASRQPAARLSAPQDPPRT